MKVLRVLQALTLLLATPALLPGQPPGPPPPPEGGGKPRPPGDGPRRPGERGDWRGFSPGFGRPPMRSDEYDKLPEEERKYIREALDKVWSRPEVMEARERTLKAHAELRQTIRRSLEKSDPKAAAILAKVEPSDPDAERELPPLPPLDSEDFPKAMLLRFGRELMAFSRPDRREETQRFHEKLLGSEAVQKALEAAQATQGEERIQAVQKLRSVYREAAIKEFQAMRDRRSPPSPEGGRPPAPRPPP